MADVIHTFYLVDSEHFEQVICHFRANMTFIDLTTYIRHNGFHCHQLQPISEIDNDMSYGIELCISDVEDADLTLLALLGVEVTTLETYMFAHSNKIYIGRYDFLRHP